MAARQSPSQAGAVMVVAVFAAAIMTVTAAPARFMTRADDTDLPEPVKRSIDEQHVALEFDPEADLRTLGVTLGGSGRQRRAVNFPSPDIIFHSPIRLDTATAGVPGSGFNITFSQRIAVSYTHLDFYLLNVGTFSGSVFARGVAVTNTSWEYVPPS